MATAELDDTDGGDDGGEDTTADDDGPPKLAGYATAVADVIAFIEKHKGAIEVSEGVIVMTLDHLSSDGKKRVFKWDYDFDDAENRAEEIAEAASNHLRGRGYRGKVSYALNLHIGKRWPRWTFGLHDPSLIDKEDGGNVAGMGFDKAGPETTRAQLEQSGRLVEVLARVNVTQGAVVTKTLQTELNRSHRRIEQLEQQIEDMRERADAADQKKWAREHYDKDLEKRERRSEAGLTIGLMLLPKILGMDPAMVQTMMAPLLAASNGGGGAGSSSATTKKAVKNSSSAGNTRAAPPADDPMVEHLAALFDSLGEEQLLKLKVLLSDEQLQKLMVVGMLVEQRRVTPPATSPAAAPSVPSSNGTTHDDYVYPPYNPFAAST